MKSGINFPRLAFLILIILTPTLGLFSQSIYEPLRLEEVESSLEDFGHMWTFDAVPAERFEKLLDFKPGPDWLEDVQKSALQFGGGCSGSFVSGSGLIMTNHHCARGYILRTLENGADILKNGFYASTTEEELNIQGLFVDQLIIIENVTAQIQNAMSIGDSDEEKTGIRDSLMLKLKTQKEEETGLKCRVIKLYQGGKYSLYSWKRYSDIRLVMVPTFQLASTGWDWDNYTYPRYELDMAFLRAYDENGDPIKTDNFFKWNSEGAKAGEAIFVVGRPGSTARMVSLKELEYLRDVSLPILLDLYNGMFQARFNFFEMHPERESELFSSVLGVSNGRKRYAGRLLAVKDPYLLTKKRDFEEKLRSRMNEEPELKEKFGMLWDEIEVIIDRLGPLTRQYYSVALLRNNMPSIFRTGTNLAKYAGEMKKTEAERSKLYKKDTLSYTREKIFVEAGDKDLDSLWAIFMEDFWSKFQQNETSQYLKIFNRKGQIDAYNHLKSISFLDDKKEVKKLSKAKPDKILYSPDPVLQAAIEMAEMTSSLREKRKPILNSLSILNQKLGELIFQIYGNEIPPDGSSTLRISEGRIKGYEYNGTLAPPKTTFFGLYNRYYGFGQKNYPWGLDDSWKEPTVGFDLSIPINFVATTDIVGGNSGSAVINKNAELIGLAFDGNMESIAGYYSYLPAKNRTVAVDSRGMIEAFRAVYKYPKLVRELEIGKLGD
jgi:Peptidase S46